MGAWRSLRQKSGKASRRLATDHPQQSSLTISGWKGLKKGSLPRFHPIYEFQSPPQPNTNNKRQQQQQRKQQQQQRPLSP
ncbi:hypothetical protein PAAG_05170 [Paracoccidioides lutzii Pb01]|uniref:Uncharacterized protein n=1 Tax=Paracoccidioides lutzii (strain ATCC MYA-826 / Pb01) TaxID=502779 RepID=C1H327_PARBA|nr:hypothetical protein PAAG_05170 [Paracoccidioides lutzii Pb01]EEH34121.2 hypothetical protein PAAG_05170 [Paracoccidioides lutzii Pb01]